MAINMGSGAVDRGNAQANGWTHIDLNNPASGSGTLIIMELWVNTSNYYECKMGTFYGSSNVYSPRDYESLGTVTMGSKQTFTGLNCTVSTNDCLGVYGAHGWVESENFGGVGRNGISGDKFGTSDVTYNYYANNLLSVYATDTTPSAFKPRIMIF
jgi:hypothetical protein